MEQPHYNLFCRERNQSDDGGNGLPFFPFHDLAFLTVPIPLLSSQKGFLPRTVYSQTEKGI